MNKHAVAQGSEFERLNIKKFVYNPYLGVLDTTWTETKTLKTYSCPFVPNKEGYATDVFHSLGCYMACGRGLYRHGDDADNSNLFHRLKRISGSGSARWLTNAIRNYLDEHVPMDAKNTVSSVSLRIAGITEMAAYRMLISGLVTQDQDTAYQQTKRGTGIEMIFILL
jgi:hypothetical protein